MPLDVAEDTLSLGEFHDLVVGFANTPGTHTHASVNEWRWPMTRESFAVQLQAVWFFNANRAKDVAAMQWEWPWRPADAVSDAERERLMAVLEKHSAFNRPDD